MTCSKRLTPRARGSARGRWIAPGALVLCGVLAGGEAQAQTAPAAPAAAQTQVPLRRIVLLQRPADLAPGGAAAEGPDVDAARAPLTGGPEAVSALRAFLGRPIGPETIGALRAAVTAAYARAGHPFVLVLTPPQDVSNGVLQVVAYEGRLGQVTVEGEKWFDEAAYRRAIQLRPGDPIDIRRLQADIDWINRNPYRSATAVARPGAAEGATDIVLTVEDRRPWGASVSLDNTGSEATGRERVNFGVDWGDAFGRGDGLTYQFVASTDFQAVRQHSASYTTDLPWRHSLIVSASYAAVEADNGPDLGSTGKSKLASVRYVMPQPRRGALTHSLGLGFDYKASDNDILFGGESVFLTTSEIDQFVLEYQVGRYDPRGATSLSLTAVASPGDLTDRNDDAHFAAQRLGARARYAYLRGSLSRQMSLTDTLTWTSRVTGQVAGGPLLPSEQLSLTGVQMVRGFAEAGAVRDQGVLWRNEIRAKTVPLGGQAGLAAYWFLDAAAGQNRKDAATVDSSVSMASTGPGIDLMFGRNTTLMLTVGVPIYKDGDTGGTFSAQFALYTRF